MQASKTVTRWSRQLGVGQLSTYNGNGDGSVGGGVAPAADVNQSSAKQSPNNFVRLAGRPAGRRTDAQ